MKLHHILIPLFLIIALSLVTGCNGASGNLDSEALEMTAVAHLTSVAKLDKTAQVIAQKTENVLPTLPATQTYAPTITKRLQTLIPTTPGPSPTLTISPTPSSTPSPTPLAKALVTGDTNCRTGPGKTYDWVVMVPAGTTVDIIARDITGQYYVIQNPFDEGVCWLWNYFVEMIQSAESLPKFANPPTPRPEPTPRNTIAPSFRIYESGLIKCDGVDSVVIRISNYSRDGFRSWRARIFNSPNNAHQATYMSNLFSHSPEECDMTISTLPYRQTGYAIIPIDVSQANRFLIEFEACTLNNKLGACAFNGLYIDKVDLVGTPP